MKPGIKMLMVAGRDSRKDRGEEYGHPGMRYDGSRNETEYETTRNEYNGAGMNYGVEGRFRDRRGREHYDGGRYAPMSNYGPENDYDVEGRGYRRDDRGRFMPRSEGTEMAFPMSPYVPPVYEEGRPMNRIGFERGPESHDRQYKQDAEYPGMMEGNRMAGSAPMMGHGRSYGGEKMTREMANEWTKGMHNEDGTKGAHWSMEQAKQIMMQKGIDCDPVEFWAVLCALYSDYCAVLKKHGVNNMDLYTDLAAAWLNDKDAVPGKAATYYECIVKH